MSIAIGAIARKAWINCAPPLKSQLFWLDAHYSGPDTSYGPEEVSLVRELRALRARKYKDIIVIDDFDSFGKKGSWDGDSNYRGFVFNWSNITISAIKEAIGWKFNNVLLKCFGAEKLVILVNLNTIETLSLFFREAAYRIFIIEEKIFNMIKSIIPCPVKKFLKAIYKKLQGK